MPNEHDEYDAYDLSEFTEDDFARIDAAVVLAESAPPEHISKGCISGGPAITIEVENVYIPVKSPAAPFTSSTSETVKSPFQEYRSYRNALSVSDLVSPAWCELQFDYGLRQQRSRKLEHRPASFLSSAGKEIFVEQKVAARNDQTVKRGKSVHKTLEREIRPKTIRVNATTEEERWALRLIDMLACLQDLRTTRGCAVNMSDKLPLYPPSEFYLEQREMPVFGIVHQQVVIGIIDEISRERITERVPPSEKRASQSSHDTPKSKRMRRTPSPYQDRMESSISSPCKSESTPTPPSDKRPSTPPNPCSVSSSPQYTLRILDTKTRRSPGLPPHEDTLQSRLQLMLYHRLLSELICQSPPFDFHALWMRLEVDPTKPFSGRFLTQAGLIRTMDDLSGHIEGLICLNDLTQAWDDDLRILDVQGIERTLQLVYRTQPQRTGRGNGIDNTNVINVIISQEEQDLAKAVEQSLKGLGGDGDIDKEFVTAIAQSIKGLGAGEADAPGGLGILTGTVSGENENLQKLTEEPELAWALQQSLIAQMAGKSEIDAVDGISTPVLGVERSTTGTGLDASSRVSEIIGTKEFVLDNEVLDAHVLSVLEYWHGTRAPRGVELAQSKRCFTCEYCGGCEWRQKKAEEAVTRFR